MPTPPAGDGRPAVVTDSTASLPPAVAADHGITVVGLEVVIGAEVLEEGSPGATPERVAEALREWTPVSTSRPGPERLRALYDRLAADGASEVVSVHVSGEMSGTVESARMAAREASVPVHVVDTRQVGVATGYAAVSAAGVVASGGTGEEAATAARARADRSLSVFYVDTLEYLRRGGRVGAASALLGGALSVKPLLSIGDGRVVMLEKVRTSSRALARLEQLVADAAGEQPVDLAVAHLAGAERADRLVGRLTERLADNLAGRPVWCAELGAVLGAHVGPGMVACCLAPLLPEEGGASTEPG